MRTHGTLHAYNPCAVYSMCQAKETGQKKWMVLHVNLPMMCRNLEVMDLKNARDDIPTQTNIHTCTYRRSQNYHQNFFANISVHKRHIS